MPTTASTLRPDMTRARPAWRMPAPRDLVVKGERIRYFEQGDGAPLVLMHGFSGSAQFEWGRVIDDLSRNHRVIAPQCVGFAPSAQPDITYSTAALVDHLGALFAALDLTGITLLGESFGGWLVGSYAVAAAQAGASLPPIARLIVVDGALGRFKWPEPGAKDFFHDAVAKEVEAMMRVEPPYDNDRTRQAIIRDSGLAKAELNDAAMAQIRVPTLLIWGDRDELIPLEHGHAAARAIPGARLVVLNDIGHIPSVECPAEFARVVDEFASQ
jgi:pimeloyl-ACP methyl ester carboxylesterase